MCQSEKNATSKITEMFFELKSKRLENQMHFTMQALYQLADDW